MKAKIVRIGNSRGVRIPKPMLEDAGMEEHVSLRVVEGGIMIEVERSARAGWAEAAALANERGENLLLDEAVATSFDEADWEW